MKKRVLAAILALAVWSSLLVTGWPAAEARESCVSQFNKSYTLTGNGADDIVAVAAAQVGKTQANLGYTEDWCTSFLADCAELAGVLKLVPAGTVSSMRSAVIAAGARYWDYTTADTITNVAKGDIVVMENGRHIALVESVDAAGIHCIDGNWGSQTPSVTRVVRSIVNAENTDWHQYITTVLRPAYPTNQTVRYTVSFDANYDGAEQVPDQSVAAGSCLTELPQPSREGRSFLGWFTDPEAGEAFTAETTVTGNIKVYAHWEESVPVQTCGPDARWSLVDGVLTISGSGAIDDYAEGNQPWAGQEQSITRICIKDGITSIGSNAFAGLAKVESVELPKSLQSIGNGAFQMCDSLRQIAIPEKVSSIGASAFAFCTHITDIILYTPMASIQADSFLGVEATVHYSDGWPSEQQGDFGGWLSWEKSVLPGDADGNGKLTLADVSLLFRIVSGQQALQVERSALDMDGNGVLGLKDVFLLYQLVS